MTQFEGPKRRHMYYPRKRSRRPGTFPTFKITYEEHELEALLALEKPKKKKDKSQVQCCHCKEMGHYANECPEKKQKYKENNQVWCNNCKELGHYVSTCPQKIHEELNLITCYNCGNQRTLCKQLSRKDEAQDKAYEGSQPCHMFQVWKQRTLWRCLPREVSTRSQASQEVI